LGFITSLHEIFSFVYHAKVENNLIEHEFDHVFAGEYEGPIRPNLQEVAECSYKNMDEIKNDIERNPGKFTSWFKIAFPNLENWWTKKYGSAK